MTAFVGPKNLTSVPNVPILPTLSNINPLIPKVLTPFVPVKPLPVTSGGQLSYPVGQ